MWLLFCQRCTLGKNWTWSRNRHVVVIENVTSRIDVHLRPWQSVPYAAGSAGGWANSQSEWRTETTSSARLFKCKVWGTRCGRWSADRYSGKVLTSGTFRITHTLCSTKYSYRFLLRSVVVQTHVSVHGVRSAEGSPAASLPTSGLTELLQRCQTRRTPQGYLNSALYSPSTRWQTVDSLYLRWIRKAWTGTDGRKWNEERQDGENEKMRQKGKDGEQIDAFTSWLVLLKSSG